ncbi:unnamed protein product [Cuscuta europaea]|uniref:Uncharacterized protein n=1 Tax=Cuscuta europaea TaxID=41803 RepID=A0A9P1E570_CUSEU|nr:unnamed protein product [Cuscuta europaea]
MEYYNSEKEIRKCSLERNITKQNENKKSRQQNIVKPNKIKMKMDPPNKIKRNGSAKQNQVEDREKELRQKKRRGEKKERRRGGKGADLQDLRHDLPPNRCTARLLQRHIFSIYLATSTTPPLICTSLDLEDLKLSCLAMDEGERGFGEAVGEK